MKKGNLQKRTAFEQAVFAIVFVVFVIYAASLMYPILFLVVNSLRSGLEYYEMLSGEIGIFSLPSELLFGNYAEAFRELLLYDSTGREVRLLEMFFHTLWYAFLTVGESVLASTFVAYCLAKFRFRLKGVITAIAIVTMTLPIVGNTGSMFQLTSELGIYNTPLYVVFVSFNGFGFSYLVLYGFFKNISGSYAEAVYIDGGNNFTAFFRVVLPQAFAPIVTLCIVNFIGAFNDYMTVLLYLPDYITLAAGLYKLQLTFVRSGNMPVYFAALIVATIPLIVIFACFSNKIMENFTVGGLKG